MRMGSRGNFGWMFGTAAIAVALAGCAAKEPAVTKAAWLTSIDAALADAKAHHRPIILDFYTDW